MTRLLDPTGASDLELWGGAECTVARVGDGWGDQTRLSGHHDRAGLNTEPPALSWNTSHPSRGPQTNPTEGCAQASLRGTGGDGLIYCFATN